MGYPIYYPVEGDVLPILFDTFDGGTGASITMTGLAVTDIEIYADGGATQRASDAGYTLLDTDGIDFDGITGIHGFSIDLGDDTDAGFFEVGPWYHVVVSAITVDGQTVNFVAAAFRIASATRGLAGTALPAAAADAAGGLPISDAGGLDLDTQIGTDIDAILVDTGTTLDGKIDTVDTVVDSILVDTGTTLDAALAVVDANVDAILVDTGTTLDAALAVVDANVDAVLVDTGTTLQDELDGIQADTEDLQTKIGTPAGASVSADIAAIEAQTDDIGIAGAGLTAIPWNAAWDAEVESEVDDALGAGTGASLTAIPWNAAWDAEVQSEAADALVAYDPPTAAELVSEIDAVQTDIAALNDLSAAAVNAEVVDVLRTDTIPDSVAADGAQPTIAQALYALHQFLMEKGVIGTTLTVRKPDGSTTLMTFTLDDADAPTDITRTS